ncbi:hypothetical protein FOA52_003161 [Chlamydomonas sp. UWO 241]|nr:hypothetical protein FOA52_003161 [Chlamydomonas sp. UWO 241]
MKALVAKLLCVSWPPPGSREAKQGVTALLLLLPRASPWGVHEVHAGVLRPPRLAGTGTPAGLAGSARAGEEADRGRDEWERPERGGPSGSGSSSGNGGSGSGGSALRRFGRDLTEEARQGRLDPVIGREDVVERTLQILLRRTKNNPILTGEAGVGKTAVVEGIAQLLVSPRVPSGLAGRRVISLDVTALVAGSAYRGEFEGRLQQVLREVAASKGRVILFIDEVHQLMGAGSSEGGLSAANILKPALARGQLQCIGATTLDEYRAHIEKDAAFARRFQPVLVPEPSPAQARLMLAGMAPRLAAHHNVVFAPGALDAAVDGAARYIPDRRLPDSAIDILDEAAAHAVIAAARTSGGIGGGSGGSGGSGSSGGGAEHQQQQQQQQQPLQSMQQPLQPLQSLPQPPQLLPSEKHQYAQNWESWVLEQGWVGPEEAHRQRLLHWFGATPADPMPGYHGHRQTAEERRRVSESWASNGSADGASSGSSGAIATDSGASGTSASACATSACATSACATSACATSATDSSASGTSARGASASLSGSDSEVDFARVWQAGGDGSAAPSCDASGVASPSRASASEREASLPKIQARRLRCLEWGRTCVWQAGGDGSPAPSCDASGVASPSRTTASEREASLPKAERDGSAAPSCDASGVASPSRASASDREASLPNVRQRVVRPGPEVDVCARVAGRRWRHCHSPLPPLRRYQCRQPLARVDVRLRGLAAQAQLIQWIACPHCGSLISAPAAVLRLWCANCNTRFLNIAPEKLQMGASLLSGGVHIGALGGGDELSFGLGGWQAPAQPPSGVAAHHGKEPPHAPRTATAVLLPPGESVGGGGGGGEGFGGGGGMSGGGGGASGEAVAAGPGGGGNGVGGAQRQQQAQQQAQQQPAPVAVVTAADVAAVVFAASGVPPVRLLSQDQMRGLAGLRDALESSVIGQREAVQAVVHSVAAWRLGLSGLQPGGGAAGRGSGGSGRRRAAASFVFAGPPGVGKSTLCAELSAQLFPEVASDSGGALLRLQMAEFSERSSLSRLLGAPPGYIGYGRGGLLTSHLRSRPGCVLVLEDAERAHPEVLAVLLRAIEEGTLSDAEGKAASLSSAVVVFTTSRALPPTAPAAAAGDGSGRGPPGGASHEQGPCQGGAAGEAASAESASASAAAAASEAAAPEPAPAAAAAAGAAAAGAAAGRAPAPTGALSDLLAAVDAVVTFRALSREAARAVVVAQLSALSAQLAAAAEAASSGDGGGGGGAVRVAGLRWDESVVGALAEAGHSPRSGLKPLAGVLRQRVLGPLAEALLAAGMAMQDAGEGDGEAGGRDNWDDGSVSSQQQQQQQQQQTVVAVIHGLPCGGLSLTLEPDDVRTKRVKAGGEELNQLMRAVAMQQSQLITMQQGHLTALQSLTDMHASHKMQFQRMEGLLSEILAELQWVPERAPSRAPPVVVSQHVSIDGRRIASDQPAAEKDKAKEDEEHKDGSLGNRIAALVRQLGPDSSSDM